MADALDINLAIYAAIFDALEADVRWATLVPVGNRIRLDKLEDPQRSAKPALADADLSQARMRLRSGGSALRTGNPTFGTHSDPDCDYTEQISLIYRLRLTSQLMTMQEDSKLVTETARVIRGLGARLGLGYVVAVKLRWETDEQEEAGEEGQDAHVRQYTNFDIMVDCEVDPASLN